MDLFDQPLKFVKRVRRGKHIVLFYEETEYARIILFEFLKSGLLNKERCVYISGKDVKAVEREMSDAGINAEEFMKNELLFVHQVLQATQISPKLRRKNSRSSHCIRGPRMLDRIGLYSDASSRLTHKNKFDPIWSGNGSFVPRI